MVGHANQYYKRTNDFLIDSKDEFARYIKLQRKIDTFLEELARKGTLI